MHTNLILASDSYKASHYLQYPMGTEKVFSYVESRGGAYDKTVFFGLQAFLKEYLTKPICLADIQEAEELLKAHGEPFNKAGWVDILRNHGGLMPVRIKAVPEGMVIPVKNVLATVENIYPQHYWTTSYLETMILRAIWYSTTVATQSWSIKNVIRHYLEETADNVEGLSFKLHDFGARGVSSEESATLGGMAHLVNFLGSDTMTALRAAKHYYNTNAMVGYSIPAAEHSTMTILGREGEIKQMERMVDQFAKPGALFAVVSDSYDIYKACDTWGTVFKDRLVKSGATLVVRPDSGNPVDVAIEVTKRLAKHFGTTTNSKGFEVLNNVRVIYGDGINETTIRRILSSAAMSFLSADNYAFGMGGALLQGVNRDTLNFAMKASYAEINGVGRDVFKEPIDSPMKVSKRGRLELWRTKDGEYYSSPSYKSWEDTPVLKTVFDNGRIVKEYTFEEVRGNAAKTTS